jgi:pyruvate dehydrogenase E1 component beta subunit
MTNLTYADAIRHATAESMRDDPSVIVLGEGVTDPKHIFRTTELAHNLYPERVIETPLSENMITGMLAGLASNGYRPIYTHARAEFSLLGMEHMVNTIGKWEWLHRGERLPVTIRMLVGRGWGQGPTHSQSFHGWFRGMHGWEVYYPSLAEDVGTITERAIKSDSPSIVIEPRRMYNHEQLFDDGLLPHWNHDSAVNIVTLGDCVIEAAQAVRILRSREISCNVYPLQDLRFNDPNSAVFGDGVPIVIVDTAHGQSDWLVSELIKLDANTGRFIAQVQPPNFPCPSDAYGEMAWYPSVSEIVQAACRAVGSPYTGFADGTAYGVRDGLSEPF